MCDFPTWQTLTARQNERSQLAFLSEQYIDLLTYKLPKEHKPSKQSDAAIHDREYTLEVLERLSNSLSDFLHAPETPSRLTNAERTHYTVVSLLSAALLMGISTPRPEPVPKTLSQLTSAIKTAFANLRSTFANNTATTKHKNLPTACLTLTDMHTLSYIRETALAIKHSATFVAAMHDKEVARDRSGRSGLHRDVLAEMKALGEIAGKVLGGNGGGGEIKGQVQKLKEGLGEGGWLDKVLDLVFGGEDEEDEDEVTRAVGEVVGGRGGAEEWAGKVIESWREGVKGWGMVRME